MEKSTYEVFITYQDVDIAGVVYFANYFNYAEKARCSFIMHIFGAIRQHNDQNWAVKSTSMSYLLPAKLEDKIIIKTYIKDIKMASFIMCQDFYVNDVIIGKMETHLLSINEKNKPIKINPLYMEKLNQFIYKQEK